jgi:putative inorganic carbon (HCO3(-)) transporter
MLRTIFVVILILMGAVVSLRGPFYGLLLYLWIAYFRPESWIWSPFLKTIDLSMYVGFYVVLFTLLSRKRLIVDRRIILLGLILLHSLISTLISDYTLFCWPYWIGFAKIILVTYLLTVLTKTKTQLKWVILVIALSLGFEGAKQGWVQLILNPGAYNQNSSPIFGDNNGVAVGMIMLVPMLLALVQTTSIPWMKAGYRFLAIGVAYRSLTTYSRGGLLALATMCGMYWLRSRHKLRTLAAVAVLAAIILPVFPKSFWARMQTMTTAVKAESSEEEEGGEVYSAVSRFYFWGVGLKMAERNPFFGVGHNGYKVAYRFYDETHGEYGRRRSVHSMWFGVMAESGFLGLLLFLLLYYQSWRSCVRARRKCGNDPTRAFLKECATAIETGLLVAAVGGAFLSFQYIEMLWHFFGLSIIIERIALAPAEEPEYQPSKESEAPAIAEAVPQT